MIARVLMVASLAASALGPGAYAADMSRLFHMARVEADLAADDDTTRATWDGEAWIGGDRHRLWLKTAGETADGDAEVADVSIFYGRNVAPFWDLLVGARQEFDPDAGTSFALGVQGLAPNRFETEAFVFVGEGARASLELEQRIDLLLTQRLALEPRVELRAFSKDDPAHGVAAGVSDVEVALRLRYEITRKFAPYLELSWERRLGATAGLAEAAGEDVGSTLLRAGLRVWF